MKYHEVFIPFEDVYNIGGPEVFKYFSAKDSEQKNLVVIPYSFIDKLERLDKENSFSGAGDVLKYLTGHNEKIDSAKNIRNISEGLDVRILHSDFDRSEQYKDIKKEIQEEYNSIPTTFITNEYSKQIKLDDLEMRVEKPKFLQVHEDIVNEGIIVGNSELQSKLYENKNKINLEDAIDILDRELYVNQFIKFTGSNKYENDYAVVKANLIRDNLGEIIGYEDSYVELLSQREHSKEMHIGHQKMDNILGVKPRDMEQYLALQYGLINPDTRLFFLCGMQGSGKTLLSYVSAIDQVLHYDKENRKLREQDEPDKKGGAFNKIILLKPNNYVGGRDVGYLPGTLYDKLKHHLAPYQDSHKESSLGGLIPFEEMLRHPKFKNDFGEPRSEQFQKIKINNSAYLPNNSEMIEITYSGLMRGRSLRNTLLLLDEAQNYTPYEVKTILERVGEGGSKAIIMGDPKQVDNIDCSRGINGLTHAVKHYLNAPYSSLVSLSRNYRSQMSKDANNWKVYSS